MFERQVGVTEDKLRQKTEIKKIAAMVDQFHKVKMDELIDKELKEKKVNDRIIVFA